MHELNCKWVVLLALTSCSTVRALPAGVMLTRQSYEVSAFHSEQQIGPYVFRPNVVRNERSGAFLIWEADIDFSDGPERAWQMRCSLRPSRLEWVVGGEAFDDPDFGCWTQSVKGESPEIQLVLARGCGHGRVTVGGKSLVLRSWDAPEGYLLEDTRRVVGAVDVYPGAVWWDDTLDADTRAAVAFTAEAMMRWRRSAGDPGPSGLLCRGLSPFNP